MRNSCDNFKTALLSHVSGQVHAEGANFIGTQGEILGYPGKALSHAVLSGLTAEISRGNVKGAVVGGLAAELAAISLGDNLINAEQWQKKSEAQAQLARAFGGIAGAVFTGQPGGVYSGATAAENSFRYNYLSHHQQTLMEKELAETANDFKKALISLKWGYTSLDQDVSLGAGMVAGAPVGLYETIDGLANLSSNPKETYTAIKAILQSDDTLGIISDAVKQSYIARLERMETEYQKAGTAGAFNAGIEGSKIIFDIASTLAGGAGIAKGGTILIEKIVTKTTDVVEKALKYSVVNKIIEAERIGSGLKPDPTHRSATYLSREQLMNGKVFTIKGGDGIERKLLQAEGSYNEKKGIFEYIYDNKGNVTHQRFIEGGNITGAPNQRIPKTK